jgi:hypothetical protein
VARIGKKNAYRGLVGEPQGKRPLEKPKRRWNCNIKMDVKEIGCEGGDWIHVAQDRDKRRAVVNTLMNPWAPQNAG